MWGEEEPFQAILSNEKALLHFSQVLREAETLGPYGLPPQACFVSVIEAQVLLYTVASRGEPANSSQVYRRPLTSHHWGGEST